MQKNYATIDELPVPNTFDMECKCLAALIDNPEYISEAKKNINDTFFSNPDNAAIWSTLCDLESKGERIDVQTIYSRTNSSHYQQFILAHNIGTLPITEVYDILNNLWNMSVKRKAYFTGLQMMQSSCNPIEGGNTPLSYATRYVEDMKSMLQTNPSVAVTDAINEYADELGRREELRMAGKPMRVITSFPTLDSLTYGGFANGNLVILAARPSVGKTAVMLQMARVAALNGIPTLVFSLEMTNNELVQRMACTSEELNIYDLNMGRVEWPIFDNAMARFTGCPLWFNDKLTSFNDIINEITIMSRKGECSIAFIDYLGLIGYPGDMRPPYQLVTETTKRLKRLAKECNIPIVLLCQLNRDMSRDGREPQLHDLRDSGSIEQDADIVLMLARATQDPERYTELMMYVRKNRQGGIGDILLRGSHNLTSFIEDGEGVIVGGADTEEAEVRMPYAEEKDGEEF